MILNKMLERIKRLFALSEEHPEPRERGQPSAGERWYLKPTPGDPWGPKRYAPVLVVDVREGWVRYSFGGPLLNDERRPVAAFLALYERH